MVLTVPLAALLGLGTGVGLLLLAVGLAPRGPAQPPSPASSWAWSRRWTRVGGVDRRRVAVAVAVGTAVALVTRWPVGALLAGAGAGWLPVILGPDRAHTHHVRRLEALAVWTESLRDNLAAAAGLEQALTASAAQAPEAIGEQVRRLALRLHRSWRLPQALRAFAEDLADPTADLVVAGLLLAASGNAGQLREVFGELAEATRATVASRQRVAAGRQRTRTSARVIVGTTLGMAAALATLNRSYLQPFDSLTGQLMLLVVGACFAGAFGWLGHLMRDRGRARVLAEAATWQERQVRP